MTNEAAETLHRGSGSSSTAGKVAMGTFVVFVLIAVYAILASPRWWDTSALALVPDGAVETLEPRPEGGCFWNIDVRLTNDTDRALVIYRGSIIVDRQRKAAPLRPPELLAGEETSLRVPIQLRECPDSLTDIDHGELRIEHRTGVDQTWSDIALPD